MKTLASWAAIACFVAAVPASAQWVTIEPGGETACADGSPYRFFVHPGDPARLVVEFEGGGACWSAETCAMEIYTRRVATDPELARRLGLMVGIYDRGNPENPVREWTHVYVPYCTGDLHWGNADRAYSGAASEYVVRHRGAKNASAALAWTFESVPAPAQVAVVGCSAGGYGSILWAPVVMARYSGARAAHLSDSAAGVVPAGFFPTVLAAWDVSAVWPKDIPSLALDGLDPSAVTMVHLYGGIAGHYPLATFSQYNADADATQVFFYGLTQGATATAEDWSAQMRAQVAAIEAVNPNFVSYTAPGPEHCILNTPSLYSTSVGGVRMVDWVSALLAGRPPSVR